jgi:hypothetical protein
VAHTTPVYVTVDNSGFHHAEKLDYNLDLCEIYLQEIEEVIAKPDERADRQAWRYKEGLQRRIAETREVIDRLRKAL